jgi:YHS domain-containing protein
MRYLLTGITTFCLAASTTVALRIHQGMNTWPHEQRAKVDRDHPVSGARASAPPVTSPLPPASSATTTPPTRELDNPRDPVSAEPLDNLTTAPITRVTHGLRIRFANERSAARFMQEPIAFFAALDLELLPDGTVRHARDADALDPPIIPVTCPLMGGTIDRTAKVYLLHRGYRIYFCCWSGCWEDFLANPSAYYAAYGLREQAGSLTELPR